jgi:hypothetical protein
LASADAGSPPEPDPLAPGAEAGAQSERTDAPGAKPSAQGESADALDDSLVAATDDTVADDEELAAPGDTVADDEELAAPGDTVADDEELASPGEDEAPRPCLRQRFSAFATVTTTVHPQGLVIQVNRPFRQRTVAVAFERLVLEPATIVSLRTGLLWTAGLLCAAGLLAAAVVSPATGPAVATGRAVSAGLAAATGPTASAGVAAAAGQATPGHWSGVAMELLGPAAPLLLVAGILVLLAAVGHPRRVTLFLDREAGLHPSFLRNGPGEDEAAAFVDVVRRAIVAFRCRAPDPDDGEAPAAPRLATTLDALLAMQRDTLLTGPELEHFRELALRR